MRRFLFLLALTLAACATEPPAEPEPAPEAAAEPAEKEPCCSVEDVVKMKGQGVPDPLIVTTIKTTGRTVELTADDVIALNQAGAGQPVIDALGGKFEESAEAADAAEEQPEAVAAPAAKPTPPPPPPLQLTTDYEYGSKSFRLTNLSGKPYTGLKLTANGEYVYRLPVPLKPGDPDRIRLSSFVSRKNGHKLGSGVGIQKLVITGDQGVWSKTW